MSFTPEFLEQAMKTSSGWAGLDGLQEKAEAFNAQLEEAAVGEAAIVKAALDSPAGRKFLEWLLAKTVLRSPANPELHVQNADLYAIAKAKREGQNAVVFMILQALNVSSRNDMAGHPSGREPT